MGGMTDPNPDYDPKVAEVHFQLHDGDLVIEDPAAEPAPPPGPEKSG